MTEEDIERLALVESARAKRRSTIELTLADRVVM
jgi:hypothetical protein